MTLNHVFYYVRKCLLEVGVPESVELERTADKITEKALKYAIAFNKSVNAVPVKKQKKG